MNKKTYFAQIAGRINGAFYEVGAPVEIEGDAKPLIDLGIIAGDGTEIEAVTTEEFAETVNALNDHIAKLTDEIAKLLNEKDVLVESTEFVSNSQQNRIEELSKLLSDATEKVVSLETEIKDVKRVNGEILTDNSLLRSIIAKNEKQAQPEPAATTPEVKEPAQAETTASVPKTSKKKS